MSALVAALLVLLLGDLGSTFLYHVPQHLWFTLHMRTHHDRRRSYWDQAVISLDPSILLDGILGALPYILVAIFAARISWQGALIGLLIGQLHVWWRHTAPIGWVTPGWLRAIFRPLQIVLPEDHDGHHRNPNVEFGDIFRFYDAPARAMMAWLAPTSRANRRALSRRAKRSARRVPARGTT